MLVYVTPGVLVLAALGFVHVTLHVVCLAHVNPTMSCLLVQSFHCINPSELYVHHACAEIWPW